MKLKLFLCLILSINCIHQVKGQDNILTRLTDFFEYEFENHSDDTNAYNAKLVLAPIVAFEPSTSLQFGVGSKLLFKFKGSGNDTRTSNLPLSLRYTLKRQFLVSSNFTMFTNHEDFMIRGTTRYFQFPFSYFGVGNLSAYQDKIELDLNNFQFRPVLLKKVVDNVFVGGGYRLNSVWNTKYLHDEDAVNNMLPSEINTRSSGLLLVALLDSRDNVLNAYKGSLIEVAHGVYQEFLGSTKEFMVTEIDARKYYRLKNRKQDVIAFQLISRFTYGNTPIYEYPNLGGKEILRGYQERRFNDKNAVFFQTEYRWQALANIGFVFYSGVGDVFSNDASDVKVRNLKYSLGTGLRLKIVKSENLNIRFDYAVGLGPESDHNFYLGLAESF